MSRWSQIEQTEPLEVTGDTTVELSPGYNRIIVTSTAILTFKSFASWGSSRVSVTRKGANATLRWYSGDTVNNSVADILLDEDYMHCELEALSDTEGLAKGDFIKPS